MIRGMHQYFNSIPAVFIDGTLYVSVGLFTFLVAGFSSDDAAKWISAHTLFWLKLSVGAVGNIALNLKMFRSTTFAEHQELKKKSGDTGFITKP